MQQPEGYLKPEDEHFEEHSVSPLLSRAESSVYKELVMGKSALIWTSRDSGGTKIFEALPSKPKQD